MWAKDARKCVNQSEQHRTFQMDRCSSSQIMFTNHAMRFAYNLATQSQVHETTREIIWKKLENINSKLRGILEE